MEKVSLAGFIMTYQRPLVLIDTVNKVLTQSYPPDKLLVVDNSDDDETRLKVEHLNDSRVAYIKVGYNAGPAGAAKIGLQQLVAEGYRWIYWGDDDDPPTFHDSFEKLVGAIQNFEPADKLGMVGAVGQNFDSITGNMQRVANEVIQSSSYIEVDAIAGNQSLIINAEVVRQGILPDPDLFFGFEELEFCLRVKSAGYRIIAVNDLYKRSREKYNRMAVRKHLYTKKKFDSLNRQYYSTRNILVILSRNRMYSAYVYQLSKAIIKCFLGFRQGWLFGKTNLIYLTLGIRDAVLGTLGR